MQKPCHRFFDQRTSQPVGKEHWILRKILDSRWVDEQIRLTSNDGLCSMIEPITASIKKRLLFCEHIFRMTNKKNSELHQTKDNKVEVVPGM